VPWNTSVKHKNRNAHTENNFSSFPRSPCHLGDKPTGQQSTGRQKQRFLNLTLTTTLTPTQSSVTQLGRHHSSQCSLQYRYQTVYIPNRISSRAPWYTSSRFSTFFSLICRCFCFNSPTTASYTHILFCSMTKMRRRHHAHHGLLSAHFGVLAPIVQYNSRPFPLIVQGHWSTIYQYIIQ